LKWLSSSGAFCGSIFVRDVAPLLIRCPHETTFVGDAIACVDEGSSG
jgi:hypothetical protein